MRLFVIFGIIGLLFFGCSKRSAPLPTQSQAEALACGNYEGKYAKGVEYVEIRLDKTFSQRFVRAGVTNYESQGTWKLEPMSDRYLIEFSPFMNLEGTILKGEPPTKYSSSSGTFYGDEPIVWILRDIDYFITKRPQKN